MLDCRLLAQDASDPDGWDFDHPGEPHGIRFGDSVCAAIRAGDWELLYVLGSCSGRSDIL
jgi:hypothetical protein